MNYQDILDKADSVLKGEPARIIGYGAAVVIYLVAKASGHIADQTPDQALISAGAAITTVVGIIETIRHFVYSPASVSAIIAATAPADASEGVTPESEAVIVNQADSPDGNG